MKKLGVYLSVYLKRYGVIDILISFMMAVITVLSTGIYVQVHHNTFYRYIGSENFQNIAAFSGQSNEPLPYMNKEFILYQAEDSEVERFLTTKERCGRYTSGIFRTGSFEKDLFFTIGDYGFNKLFPLLIKQGKNFTFTEPEMIISWGQRHYYQLGERYALKINLPSNQSLEISAKVVGYSDGLSMPELYCFYYGDTFLSLPNLEIDDTIDFYSVSQDELDALQHKPATVYQQYPLYTIANYFIKIPKSADDLNLIAYGAFILFMLIVFIIMTGAYVNGRNQRKLQGTALLVGISKRDLFVANLLRAAAIFVFSLVVTAAAIAWAGQTFYQLTFGGLPVGALVPLALCGLLALIDYLQLRKLEIHAVLKAET